MGPKNRKPDYLIEELLSEEAYKFDFYQAVKLLDQLHLAYKSSNEYSTSDKNIVGKIFNKEGASVNFRSKIAPSFPASDIEEVTLPDNTENPFEMTVNFLGLAGVSGPLPYHYTQSIIENEKEEPNNKAFRDFLDIFNNRLVQLFYEIRKKHRIGFELGQPEDSSFAEYMFSLIGMGTEKTRRRLSINDRIFLNYIGFFANHRRPITGLEYIISDYFNINVEANSFIGKWQTLEEDQLTFLGNEGQNQILGDTSLLGNRIWDQEAKFELRLGPLSGEEFFDFLPIEGSLSFLPLYELTRHYVGPELDFDIVLIVKAEEIKTATLGSKRHGRLGWTSWLQTKDDGIFNYDYLYFLQSQENIKMKLSDGKKLRLGWTVWTPDENGKVKYIEVRISSDILN